MTQEEQRELFLKSAGVELFKDNKPDADEIKENEEGQGTGQEDIKEPENKSTVEETQTDDSEGVFTIVTEEETEEVKEEPQPKLAKKQVKLQVDDYLKNNESVLKEYFKLKDLKVSELSDEQVVLEKLKRKNPYWTDLDIKDEMRVIYGIGLEKKEITDDMTDEAVKEAERFNKEVEEKERRGSRLLKSDSYSFRKELEELTSNLSLPEFDTEVELDLGFTNSQTEDQEKLIKEQEEYVNNVWIPSVDSAVSKVKGVRQVLKVEVGEGVHRDLELSYTLTDKQKEGLQTYMHSYVGQPSDQKFVSEDGKVDYDSLVQEKIMWLYAPQIISAMAKESLAHLKEEFFKDNLVNYDSGTTKAKAVNGGGEMTYEDFFMERAKAIKTRN